MTDVRDQYEAFPYPTRDPADEATRLITGSPSFPAEMDHCLWGGQRDWSQTLRVLVAGGGTGDGLVQLAQRLTDAGKPYDITYVDLSSASRKIAEARVKARKLQGITFETGSLLDAASLGTFDYIDCCGVLHHLPDPRAGLQALRAALAPDGGLGFMVYAPYGRSGVYPLQAAFNRLFGHLPPKSRLKHAKAAFETIPEGHPLRRNLSLSDHQQSDAGFYDLLIHSQDQAFTVATWIDALQDTGWKLASFAQPGLYDLTRFAEVARGMNAETQMSTAEELRGTIKTHVGYARAADDSAPVVEDKSILIPHLNGILAADLARAVKADKLPTLRIGSDKVEVTIPVKAAALIAGIDGRRTLGEITHGTQISDDEAARLWGKVESAVMPWGVLHYSRYLV